MAFHSAECQSQMFALRPRGEYLSDEFSVHLKLAGTIRKLTMHDTPKHNGVSKRLNRTIMEKVRAMLHKSGMPKFLWAEAVVHTVYLKNRTWTRTIGYMTPYKIIYGRKPNITHGDVKSE